MINKVTLRRAAMAGLAALALGAAMVGTTEPASAWWGGGWHHGWGWHGGWGWHPGFYHGAWGYGGWHGGWGYGGWGRVCPPGWHVGYWGHRCWPN